MRSCSLWAGMTMSTRMGPPSGWGCGRACGGERPVYPNATAVHLSWAIADIPPTWGAVFNRPLRRGSVRGLLQRQVLVDDADGHRALADGGGDALDRAGAPVTDREDAGQAGLQRQRGAADHAAGAAEVGHLEVDAGEEEAV